MQGVESISSTKEFLRIDRTVCRQDWCSNWHLIHNAVMKIFLAPVLMSWLLVPWVQ